MIYTYVSHDAEVRRHESSGGYISYAFQDLEHALNARALHGIRLLLDDQHPASRLRQRHQ